MKCPYCNSSLPSPKLINVEHMTRPMEDHSAAAQHLWECSSTGINSVGE